jgi:hypothetical protein
VGGAVPAIVRWLAVLTLFQAGDLKSLRKQEVHALTSITAGERARLCAHLVGAVWAVSYEPAARQQLLKEGGVQVLHRLSDGSLTDGSLTAL